MIALGLAVTAVGMTPESTFLWALISMSCVGMIAPLMNGPVQANLQSTIAPDYQGRVFTLVGSLAGVAAPLGLIVAAPVAEVLHVGAWYWPAVQRAWRWGSRDCFRLHCGESRTQRRRVDLGGKSIFR